MSYDVEWADVQLWLEVERRSLYPPEAELKPKIWGEWLADRELAGKDVLDLGCGSGRFGELLNQHGANVIGSDISDAMLEEASKTIPVRKADAYSLPFADKSFDYVVSSMLLHVVPNVARAFAEIHRVLRPGGEAFIGIVHPEAELWDENTNTCYEATSKEFAVVERSWVFNLTDGRSFTKHYQHRPRDFYDKILKPHFKIGKTYEPIMPSAPLSKGKYACREFLNHYKIEGARN